MTEIKICGLTNIDDARCALDLGVDYLGCVLYPKSPRSVSVSELAKICDALDNNVKVIGVFVNENRANIEKIALDCNLYAVQIHGDEDYSEFSDTKITIWKAVRIEDGEVKPALNKWPAARYVIDADVSGEYGGTGVTADWNQAAELATRYPLMLAGGLTPENVGDAVRIVEPRGVDVASGVELMPGRKDHEKMKRFVKTVKGVCDE